MKTIVINNIQYNAAIFLYNLYHGTMPLGRGIMHNRESFSVQDAEKILEDMNEFNFDYVAGRPIKVWQDNDGVVASYLYDRDAFTGAFDKALEKTLAMQ